MTTDTITKVGEEFGLRVARLISSVKLHTVTVVSIDDAEENALVRFFDNDTAMPVPLSLLNIAGSTVKVTPTVGSLAVIASLNGNEDTPCFVSLSSVDRIAVNRSQTSVSWVVDPDDETQDELTVSIGESTLRVTGDEMAISNGSSNLRIVNGLIEMNGGSNDGLVKINELTEKLNSLVQTFNSHTFEIPVGSVLIAAQAGVSNTAPIPLNRPTPNADTFSAEDYKNEKITQ